MFHYLRVAFSLGLILAAVYPVSPAVAQCTCKCVAGELVTSCSGAMKYQPVCPVQQCPRSLPNIKPNISSTLPPAGSKQCRQARVWDAEKNRYAWENLCD